MAAPIANFTFTTNGLTAQFTDATTGGVISWLWDFGFLTLGVPTTSTGANPLILFPGDGIYQVSLTATNAEGSNTFFMLLVMTTVPNLNLTILEMVLSELPSGIPVNRNTFNNLIKKWQLFLQPAQHILDADVFNETKWKPIANVLIAKLIIYELINLAAQSAMGMVNAHNNSNTLGTTTVVLLTDYSLAVDFTSPLTIESVLLDNTVVAVGLVANDMTELLAIMNGLTKGIWVANLANTQIISLANRYLYASLTYHTVADSTPIEAIFNQSNQVLSTVTTTSTGTTGTTLAGKGPLKSIATGPAKAEWYDNSAFWKSMFSSSSSSSSQTGFGDGVIGSLKEEICMYARRVGVRLFFCPQRKSTRVFIVGTKTKNC